MLDWSLIQSRAVQHAISDDTYWDQCYVLTAAQNIPNFLRKVAGRVLSASKAVHLLNCMPASRVSPQPLGASDKKGTPNPLI